LKRERRTTVPPDRGVGKADSQKKRRKKERYFELLRLHLGRAIYPTNEWRSFEIQVNERKRWQILTIEDSRQIHLGRESLKSLTALRLDQSFSDNK
jgi:hypothetical protein